MLFGLLQGCWSRWVSIFWLCLRCLIGHRFNLPNRRLNRFQEWHRCGSLQKRERSLYDLLQVCWSRWVSCDYTLIRCRVRHPFLIPNRKQNRCQEWRRCGNLQKRERSLYDLLQGCWSRWVSCDYTLIRCRVGHRFLIPNRKQNRCQEWRRCAHLRQKAWYLYK